MLLNLACGRIVFWLWVKDKDLHPRHYAGSYTRDRGHPLLDTSAKIVPGEHKRAGYTVDDNTATRGSVVVKVNGDDSGCRVEDGDSEGNAIAVRPK